MSIEFINQLPTPAEIKEQYPLPARLAQVKQERDQEIPPVWRR